MSFTYELEFHAQKHTYLKILKGKLAASKKLFHFVEKASPLGEIKSICGFNSSDRVKEQQHMNEVGC